MSNKATHRGECQVCSKSHKVNPKTGQLAKHGYTVVGWFHGTCEGAGVVPFEKSMETAQQVRDRMIDRSTKLNLRILAEETAQDHVWVQIGGRGQRIWHSFTDWNVELRPAAGDRTYERITVEFEGKTYWAEPGYGSHDLTQVQRINLRYSGELQYERNQIENWLAWMNGRLVGWSEKELTPID